MLEVLEWEKALEAWLEPFLEALGHKARCRWAPVYLRGLLGRSERKSVQPMAAELTPNDYDQLHNFIASPAWDTEPLETVLAGQADALVGGDDAVLVIDDTALPKKGTRSVGVASQYASVLGKVANCQVLVSLTLARGEVPVPVALRLFLPERWSTDPERCRRCGVPPARLEAGTKLEIALAELDRLRGLGVRFGAVVADAGYGVSADFRQGLSARELTWAVGIPSTQTVYTTSVVLTWPAVRTGRPRKRAVASEKPIAAPAMLQPACWQRVVWRQGTTGPLVADFAALRIRVADGPPQRDGTPLPGDEVWLIGERRTTGEHKYYLSNLPPDTPLAVLAALVKSRWVCEQGHQQMKEELGLDHFEGRSWHGLHHHGVMVMMALAFLQHLRLNSTPEREKNAPEPEWPTATADPAGHPQSHPRQTCCSTANPLPFLSSVALSTQTGIELPK